MHVYCDGVKAVIKAKCDAKDRIAFAIESQKKTAKNIVSATLIISLSPFGH